LRKKENSNKRWRSLTSKKMACSKHSSQKMKAAHHKLAAVISSFKEKSRSQGTRRKHKGIWMKLSPKLKTRNHHLSTKKRANLLVRIRNKKRIPDLTKSDRIRREDSKRPSKNMNSLKTKYLANLLL
jgi:hypothetical protein